MKKVKVIVSGILMLVTVGMFAQTTTDNLPATAQDFINQHFASATVEEVKENSSWQIWEDEKFEVRFSNGIELDFDENGNLLEIDSERNEGIPLSALPSQVASYLQANYADVQVTGWEKNSNGQEVNLMNGIELEFDEQGNFVKID